MKRCLIVVTLLMLLSMLLPGCGATQPESEPIQSEFALQEEICEAVGEIIAGYELQCELDLKECEGEKTTLEDEVNNLRSQLADCKAEKSAIEKQISGLEDQLAECEDCSYLEDQIEDLEDNLAKCQNDLENCRTDLDDCQNDLNNRDKRICELLEELEECEGWSIKEPQIVGQLSHRQMIEFLRDVFPKAEFRGVEEAEFDLTSKGEIERFLDEMPERSFSDNGDFIFSLMGQFTNQSGWEDIPIGWAKKSDGEFYAVTVVKGLTGLTAYKIKQSGQMSKISSDSSVRYCLIG